MGRSPYDVVFDGSKGVYAEEGCGDFQVGSLDTFWRSAENFHTKSNEAWAVGTGMTWAVSQAAPLRNVVVDNDLLFFEYTYGDAAGYASGGWGSGLNVGGEVVYGSQQQFMTRSSASKGGFGTPVWNGVFVGNDGQMEERCGTEEEGGHVAVKDIGRIAEKPFIVTDENGEVFTLIIPDLQESPAAGVPYDEKGLKGGVTEVDFENVYVTQEGDGSKEINEMLDQGLHIVVSPGIYNLEESLLVGDSQVLLGLGLATLIAPSSGDPCVIAKGKGSRVSGLLLEAGPYATSSLLLVSGDDVVVTDVFARVGGPTTGVGPVGSMFDIEGSGTVVDNTWLWRADHIAGDDGEDVLVRNSDNECKNGMVVRGENVTAYGLASEHTIEDNVVWEGEGGRVYFYQAEIMYDFLGDEWEHSCLRVGDDVEDFKGFGLGCYSYFRDADGVAVSGVKTGGGEGVVVEKAVSVFLNGGGGIENVVNDDGLSVKEGTQTAFHC
jgi:hypothetical protein